MASVKRIWEIKIQGKKKRKSQVIWNNTLGKILKKKGKTVESRKAYAKQKGLEQVYKESKLV